jgi:tetratricopeptide (TPR) repeat protein
MKYAALLLLLLFGSLVNAASDPAQVTFDRAAQALSKGDYGAAEQGFALVLTYQPNNVAAIANLGVVYSRMNRIDKAITQYQDALRLSPNDAPILLNLGIVYLKEEMHARALPYFERVLAIDSRNQQARPLRDLCLLYTGQVLPALGDLKALVQENPGDEQLLFLLGFAYLKNGDSQMARTIFDQMFKAAGPVRAQFLLGKASYDAALFSQSEESFLQVLRLDPQFPGVHLELGKVYISERRTTDAIEQLKVALGEDTSKEEANYFLGSLLVRENQCEQGIAYLEEARKLKPDSYGVYLYLGKARLRLGQAADAAALLRKAVQLNPNDANAELTLARALKISGQETAAREAFDRVRSLNDRVVSDATIPGVR